MSSAGNKDDPEINPDQPNPEDVEFGGFDTQPLSPLLSETMEETQIMDFGEASTGMQDDVTGAEDACETQIMDFGEETQLANLDGETQVVDFGCETQALNFDGETQALYFDGETQALNFDGETQGLDFDGETQVVGCSIGSKTLDGWLPNNEFDNGTLFNSDGEGSYRTDVLDDSDEQCDDDPCGQHVADSVEKKKIDCNSTCMDNENRGQPDSCSNHMCRSDSLQKGFTSIRAASLRAFGLAARARTLSGDKEMSLSSQISRQSSEVADDGVFCMEVDARNDNCQNEDKVSEFKGEGSCKIRSSAARKLFADEVESDDDNGFNRTVESTELSSENDELAGLSYIDSQEPGDLSQANALDFVDKFLKEASNDLHQESNFGKTSGRKSLSVSGAKGPQRLAKSANKMSLREKGIFDWDDFCEDEGGGDFFCRKKDLFFNTVSRQMSLTHPLKHKGGRFREARNSSKASSVPGKITRKLDTRLSVIKEVKNDETAEMIYRRNLALELDEQPKQDLLRGNAEHTEFVTKEANMVEIPNVGYDTQLAAEAMEALCHGNGLIEADNSSCQLQKNGEGSDYHKGIKGRSSVKSADNGPINGIKTRQTRKRGQNDSESSKLSSVSVKKQFRKKSHQGAGSTEIHRVDEAKKWVDSIITTEVSAAVKPHIHGEVTECTPVARRTRTRLSVMAKVGTENLSGTTFNNASNGGVCRGKRSAGSRRSSYRNAQVSKMCKNKEHSAGSALDQSKVVPDAKAAPDGKRSAGVSATAGFNDSTKTELSCVNMSPGESSDQVCIRRKLDGICEQSFVQKVSSHSVARCKQSNSGANISSMDRKRKTRSYTRTHAAMSNEENMGEVHLPVENLENAGTENAVSQTASTNLEGKLTKEQINMPKAAEPKVERGDPNNVLSAGDAEAHARLDITPNEKSGVYNASCNTPVNQLTPLNIESPVCMGNEYFKQSRRRNLSGSYLLKEIKSLSALEPGTPSPCKDLRRRRDMSEVQVLCSHHLDDDIVKQQKKILARLGGSMASCIADATHFVTDKFVRTRNMLEAMASGKPVVTHLWLEGCGQASCYLGERNYLLRDARKEKEFGFSMPVSLARASRHPLLHGQKVFVTPNTKPGKEIISSLVKAVHGQPAERIGRSALKDDKVPDDLLILSCEEDYNICIPFLEKGAAIYSSELLLNGIVTQNLEYERHRLFVDHVRRTRKTLWLKKDGVKFVPVGKQK